MEGSKRSFVTRSRGIALVAVGLAGWLLVGAGGFASPGAGTGTIYACAKVMHKGKPNQFLGSLRLVSQGTVCKKNEQLVTWNAQGPQGDAGQQGAQGNSGTSGLNGADGAPGLNGAP